MQDPGKLFTRLDEADDVLKADTIYFAGEHFRANAQLARTKSNAAVIATAGLVLEIVALMIWLAH